MADYSTYITLYNDTPDKLYLVNKDAKWGYWAVNPPSDLDPFSASAQFRLADSTGPAGSEGWVRFKTGDEPRRDFLMTFCDAYSGDNYCNIENPAPAEFSVYFRAKTTGDWQTNICPTSGHPLHVEYHVKRALAEKK